MKFIRVPLLFLFSIAAAVTVLVHLQVPDVEAQGPAFGATLSSGQGPPSTANCIYASIYSDILNKHTYACQAPTYPQWVQVDGGAGLLSQANTWTATQHFAPNISGWAISATGSSLAAEADDYGATALTFGSYYRSDWLVADGHGENTPFLTYIEGTSNVPVTDGAAGDTVVNAAPTSSIRLGFCGGTACTSAVQVSATAANFNAIPVETTNLTLGGTPVTQATTLPTGSCTTVGWVLSNDGHIAFCNGTIYVTKI